MASGVRRMALAVTGLFRVLSEKSATFSLRQPLATHNKPGSQFTPATKRRSGKDSASLQRETDPQESSFFAFRGFGAIRARFLRKGGRGGARDANRFEWQFKAQTKRAGCPGSPSLPGLCVRGVRGVADGYVALSVLKTRTNS